MPKKLPSSLAGKKVKLLESLRLDGHEHPHAGAVGTVQGRVGPDAFEVLLHDSAETVTVAQGDWGPTDEDMQAMLAKPSPRLDLPVTPANQVKLREDLLDDDGEQHEYAGETVIITARLDGDKFTARVGGDDADDGDVLMVKAGDWLEPTTPLIFAAPEFIEQLATINLFTDPALNQVVLMRPGDIDESPFNPRTNYPEDEEADMAASARANGIIQAALVRPMPNGRHEVVFGHRRRRAAIRGELEFMPVFVRELTDEQSAQLQAVENTQRRDLDPIDEGLGFAAYCKTHNITKDQLVQRIGKSRTHIYNRLKLATLHEDGRKALRNGRIRPEVATLIARVPGEKHQAHALKLIMDNTWASAKGDELMTVRKARDMLREKFTLALKGALWQLDDATLVESAGACTTCPKRSGSDPIMYVDLLGDAGSYRSPTGENVCTDPACFDTKKTAQLKANQIVLEAKGKVVVAGNKARQAVSAQGEVKGAYIALKDVKEAIKKATVKGKPAPAIETVTIQNPRDGKTIEVVKREDMVAAGVSVPAPKKTGHGGYGSDDWKQQQAEREAQREREQAKAKRETEIRFELLQAVRAVTITKTRSQFDMMLVLDKVFGAVGHWERDILCKLYGANSITALGKSVDTMTVEQIGQLMLDCALVTNVMTHGGNEKPAMLEDAAKHYGVDAAALRKEAQARASRADAEQRKAEVKKAEAKKPTAAKAKPSPAKAGTPAKKVAAKPKKKAAQAVFMAPMACSEKLQAIVGTTPLPRTEIVSKLWTYVKKKSLQDKANKRMINCDDTMKSIFGKSQVSMFEMAGLIAKHVTAVDPLADAAATPAPAKTTKKPAKAAAVETAEEATA